MNIRALTSAFTLSRLILQITLQSIVGATAIVSVQAFAGPAFVKLDTNNDGVISREEAAAHPKLAAHFDKIDTNKDGVLSRDELKAARQLHQQQHQQKIAAKFAKLDTDHDGRLSRQEVQSAPHLAKYFDVIDTNKDGYLSAEELTNAHLAIRKQRNAQ